MKAIMVIDLDDQWLNTININCNEMFADVTIYKKESLTNQCDYSQRIYRCWLPLKALPKSRVMLDYRELMDKLDEHEYPEYWDAAIEETEKIEAITLKDILGGNE